MSELKEFFTTGNIEDFLTFLTFLEKDKNYEKGLELCKKMISFFPYIPKLLFKTFDFCIYNSDYQTAFDTLEKLKKFNIDMNIRNLILSKQSICINYISNNYTKVNESIKFKILNKPKPSFPMITFTITTCKRLDLFIETMNSFLNCCTDLDLIDYWFCVDDNSSESDRIKMKELFPFFTFYFKTEKEKGHSKSMNIIYDNLNTPYFFHLEDDWKFFVEKQYITDCLDILKEDNNYGQCLINKNYAETANCMKISGGEIHHTVLNTRYLIHEFCENQTDWERFYKKHGNCFNCAYWSHYSLRPSLCKTSVFKNIGKFNEKDSHFEREYSNRYYNQGYRSVFLDGIYCLHIGRLTSERFDMTKKNAYDLNGENQFGETKKAIYNIDNKNISVNQIKTFLINLDRRKDRLEKLEKNPDFIYLEAERFPAIDGNLLQPNPKLQKIFEGNDYNMRAGIVGCALSHLKLYINLVNSNLNCLLILEDDIVFCHNFKEKYLKCLSMLPKEYDIIYLGHHAKIEKKDEGLSFIKTNSNESLKISYGGNFSYLISKKGAIKLLNFIERVGMTNAIDTMIQKAGDIIDLYYLSENIIKSDMFIPNLNHANITDIQVNFKSLNLKREYFTEHSRLKKEERFCLQDAIIFEK